MEQKNGEYLDKISELKHKLGECNVEWGACEQERRLKDELNIKQLHEIETQKQKYSICSEQFKKCKQTTQ